MRNAIWKAMLDADMNARYWKYLVGRYVRKDKAIKIFLAAMTSSTVASWQFWETTPGLWKGLSAISAVIAIASPILNYQKLIEQLSELAGKWGELRIEYEDLWLQVQNYASQQALESAYRKFRKIESGLQEKEAKLPDDKRLVINCFNEVKQTRGLTTKEVDDERQG